MQATDNCMFIQIISEYKTCIHTCICKWLHCVYTNRYTCKTCTPIIHVYRYVYHKDMRIFTCSLITMNLQLCTYQFIYNYTDNCCLRCIQQQLCIFTCKLKIIVNGEYTTTIIAGVYIATSLLLKTLVTEVYCESTAMK